VAALRAILRAASANSSSLSPSPSFLSVDSEAMVEVRRALFNGSPLPGAPQPFGSCRLATVLAAWAAAHAAASGRNGGGGGGSGGGGLSRSGSSVSGSFSATQGRTLSRSGSGGSTGSPPRPSFSSSSSSAAAEATAVAAATTTGLEAGDGGGALFWVDALAEHLRLGLPTAHLYLILPEHAATATSVAAGEVAAAEAEAEEAAAVAAALAAGGPASADAAASVMADPWWTHPTLGERCKRANPCTHFIGSRRCYCAARPRVTCTCRNLRVLACVVMLPLSWLAVSYLTRRPFGGGFCVGAAPSANRRKDERTQSSAGGGANAKQPPPPPLLLLLLLLLLLMLLLLLLLLQLLMLLMLLLLLLMLLMLLLLLRGCATVCVPFAPIIGDTFSGLFI